MLKSLAPVDCAALAARLVQHPQLAQRFGEVMDLVDNAAGDIRSAHLAEERAIAVLRDMGNEALHAWGQRAAAAAAQIERSSKKSHPHAQKKFTGTPRLAVSR